MGDVRELQQPLQLPSLLFLLLPLVLTSCAPAGGVVVPVPAPVVVAPAPDPLAAPWVVTRSATAQSATITHEAVLELRADTVVRVDTVTSRITVRASHAPPSGSAPSRWVGTITSYGVAVGGGPSVTPAGLTLPIAFRGDVGPGATQPRFVTPATEDCSAAAGAAVQGIRDLWIALPDTLEVGTTWRDSTSYLVCRDAVPLRATVQRSFRATGASKREGVTVVSIERRATTTLTGSGVQFDEPVTITGRGESALMLEVALTGGAIRFGSGTASLEMTVAGKLRQQRVKQTGKISIQ